jgi:hypothetical protein
LFKTQNGLAEWTLEQLSGPLTRWAFNKNSELCQITLDAANHPRPLESVKGEVAL